MRCEKFEGCNMIIAEGQDEYDTLHGMLVPGHEREIISKFVLNKEELRQIMETGEIWFSQQTFGKGYTPILISTSPRIFNTQKVSEQIIGLMCNQLKIKDEFEVPSEMFYRMMAALDGFFPKHMEYYMPSVIVSLGEEHKLPEGFDVPKEFGPLEEIIQEYYIFISAHS